MNEEAEPPQVEVAHPDDWPWMPLEGSGSGA